MSAYLWVDYFYFIIKIQIGAFGQGILRTEGRFFVDREKYDKKLLNLFNVVCSKQKGLNTPKSIHIEPNYIRIWVQIECK